MPSFKSEWYWHQLMSGNAEFVEFHNRVYGCSGVMPEKYPCTGPPFKYSLLCDEQITIIGQRAYVFRYADFAPMFKAEMFDPDHWASVFKSSGAKCEIPLWKLFEAVSDWHLIDQLIQTLC